jgi:hypothetical protein
MCFLEKIQLLADLSGAMSKKGLKESSILYIVEEPSALTQMRAEVVGHAARLKNESVTGTRIDTWRTHIRTIFDIWYNLKNRSYYFLF